MTAEQPKKQRLLEFRGGEENVRRWIDEFVSDLDRSIEQEQIREEREF